ncbi:Retrovirus-related Pol polyprotein from transposon RE1 [Vitis vinifera]|uniref:Retrovirus-related Pol polyprotein from transposon RE1 n=1 Tax=Vitis vinifera TaxID=29760 RepID=A0A438GUU8_VITVI|nr:Retrovirus-related Pol polyprotein from transposon RE1 [Vitis vinifera]
MSLRLAWPFSSTPTFLLVSGLTLSALQLISSTGCPLHFLVGFVVLIPPPLGYTSPATLNLMNSLSYYPKLPGPTSFLSSYFKFLGTTFLLPPLASSPHSIELATDSSSSLGSHPMITRAKAGIFKARHPANLGNPAWLAAMDEEVQALQQNGTWILVSWPVNTNIVGSKWVFGTKYFPDGSVERLKLLLRVVLFLAVTNKWPLRQLDVKNTFLNGTLTEHVYMEQPPGYIDSRFPTHVYLLKKALYGLKQAPRAWFQRFSSFLLTLGFSSSRADTSFFVFHQQSSLIYLLLYVDDIIVTGNNPSLLDSFTRKLHSEFATKDLGSLSYFRGLEASPTPDGLFISQLKYT